MPYLKAIINFWLDLVVGIAEALGYQYAVEVSDHSINVELTKPDKEERAWDPDLFRNGNLFVQGYANPIKPQVDHKPQLENPNTVEVAEGETDRDGDDRDDQEASEDRHVNLISSARYRDYMRQDLVSQLLTPKEQWRLLAYGILGLGVLQFMAIFVTMYATGAF